MADQLSPEGIQEDELPQHHPLYPIAQRFQKALILHGPRQPYQLVSDWPIPPILHPNEVLIKISCVGLNPIDWKSPDFAIALPSFPAVTGRDLAGTIVSLGDGVDVGQLPLGSHVFGPSTQYRDYRTSAFQEYAILPDHCISKVPEGMLLQQAAAIGVAAVASVMILCFCFDIPLHALDPRLSGSRSEDEEDARVVEQMLSIDSPRAPKLPSAYEGQWLLIWGGSTVSGFFLAQLAKKAKMNVIAVVDVQKHGARLRAIGLRYVIDRADPLQAISQILSLTSHQLVYAVDCVSQENAEILLHCLQPSRGRLVGLCGIPKIQPEGVEVMGLPIKTFHSEPTVGRETMNLIRRLIEKNSLVLPDVEVLEGGFGVVNQALDRMRKGDINFGRLVVQLS